ncbi:MAG: SRPBCC domain-containing protein [Ginsengibacter sp.]
MLHKKVHIAFIMSLAMLFTKAQTVRNTSYTTPSGEKVLRLEIVVPVGKKTAWEYFTKDELLQKWIAPLVHIELKTGGYILTNYDETKSLEDSSAIRLAIINYLPDELLTLKVKLNNNFPKSVQDEDANLQELIQFQDAGGGKTRLISSMIGWGKGEDWDKAYGFFVRGNVWTYEQLYKAF